VASRKQPEQQAPPVQRLRVRYAKRGRARFTSHRDFGRAFERALRRAGVPMAYSSGFSPHPRISYANASPTGAASEAEYLEIGLAERCDPAKVQGALDAALPPGLDVVEVVPSPPGALADLLTGSRWAIDLVNLDAAVVEQAVDRLLAEQSVQVERLTKNGLRHFDARAAVVSLGVSRPGGAPEPQSAGPVVRLLVTLAHTVPAVRPDDVLAALVAVSPDATPAAAPVLTRLSQGALDRTTGTITEP
jgi:radical SAM-linked protein